MPLCCLRSRKECPWRRKWNLLFNPRRQSYLQSKVSKIKAGNCVRHDRAFELGRTARPFHGSQQAAPQSFTGTYQQEDRDARKNRSKDGVRKHHMFMVRCKMPAGRLTAAQYLAMDDLAGQFANGTLRFTTRQGIQLHGVLKTDLKATELPASTTARSQP